MPGELVDLATEFNALAQLAGRTEENLDAIMVMALDALARVVPYELASVLELDAQGMLRVRVARGPLADAGVRHHKLRLSDHPSLVQVMQRREAKALTEHDHEVEGDPFDGVLDLPHGHSCMVLPLYAEDQNLGFITFDRSVCEPYAQNTVEIASVYGLLIGQAVLLAERARLLRRAHGRLQERNRLLRQELRGEVRPGDRLLASRSHTMKTLLQAAQQVAVTTAPVLIAGETGVGKELFAQAVHDWSPRREQAFVKLNCAALPENLIESELFGHVRGAFSGADRDRPGRFVSANGGSLLLDEVGELPAGAQAKLLRVLQEGSFEPVGSDKTIKVDVRIIAASHVDLQQAVRAGTFRQDLYYRLAVFPLHIPPLRERSEDIAAIAGEFLRDLELRSGRGPWTLGDRALKRLQSYAWPGNVRELLNVLERATIIEGAGMLRLEKLNWPKAAAVAEAAGTELEGSGTEPWVGTEPEAGTSKVQAESIAQAAVPQNGWPSLVEYERAYVQQVLQHTGGKIYGKNGAAKILGLKPSTLQSRIKRLFS